MTAFMLFSSLLTVHVTVHVTKIVTYRFVAIVVGNQQQLAQHLTMN